MEHPAREPGARLRWDAKVGFQLDYTAVAEGLSLMLVGVPVPADGTLELAEPVELDKLEILFKADVDVDGAPGQLHEARIQLVKSSEAMSLEVVVEDAESGARRTVQLEVPLLVEGSPPESGGPRAEAATEDELDWDDETTFERMFSDMTPAPAAEAPPPEEEAESAEAKEERGFAALLRALVSDDLQADDPGLHTPEPPPTRAESAPDLARMDPHGVDEARDLLAFLVEQEQLELVEGATLDGLSVAVAPLLMARRGSWEDKAAAISSAILDHDDVEELYLDDDSLAELLEKWM